MTLKGRLALALLVLLAGATAFGIVRTRPARSAAAEGADAASGDDPAPVDQSPMITARRVQPFAATPEERSLAADALRLADHVLDLAFLEALRQAAEHPPLLNDAGKEMQARLADARRRLKDDQARVARLSSDLARAEGERKDALSAELELVKAQAELDQDEVDDAAQDLDRVGGNPGDRLQQMAKEHEAAAHAPAAQGAAPEGAPGGSPASAAEGEVAVAAGGGGLVRTVRLWWNLGAAERLLADAALEAQSAVPRVSAEHAALEREIEAPASGAPAAAAPATSGAPASKGTPAAAAPQSLVESTRRLASGRKALTRFDQWINDEKELARVYARWGDLVAGRRLAALHASLIAVAIALLIALAALLADIWLERLLERTRLDRRRVEQLRMVTRVAIRVAGVVLVLLVVAGPPHQVATVLGLAGAGLTVALKDFIVGFIGWFVLMGRNGIRVGDWVEINGVSGEVVDLGPLHTVLLETGNWAESGHPTGRRVTFVNNFAIEGHYFNFSTSGQWLWDEVQFHLPRGRDPYPILPAITEVATRATQANARLAEDEWRGVARSKELQGFSAEPAVSLRPGADRFEVVVRYITRANERHQMRSRLYQEVVALLGRTAAGDGALPAGTVQTETPA